MPITRDHAVAQLREIFSAVLGVRPETITGALAPDTCDTWDSLHHIHLVSAIDENFGIHLEIEQQVEMITFDLATIVVCDALRTLGRLAD